MTWIDNTFPGLLPSSYSIDSRPTTEYNCIAYAAGDESRWWQHIPGYYWPAQRAPTIESLVAVFEGLGYEICADGESEDGFEKVALYAKGRSWTHAARQLPDGRWVSKLGSEEDISHPTAQSLESELYGAVYRFMKRMTS